MKGEVRLGAYRAIRNGNKGVVVTVPSEYREAEDIEEGEPFEIFWRKTDSALVVIPTKRISK